MLTPAAHECFVNLNMAGLSRLALQKQVQDIARKE
jgi:hypothetical protein